MTRAERGLAAVLIAAAIGAVGTGCGSDASAGAFPGPTATPAAALRGATPVPTATEIPADG